MNKEDYINLHCLLAKLRFELGFALCETNNEELIKEYQDDIAAIENVMKIFTLECEYHVENK